MTALEVFMMYSKIRGIIPSIHKIALCNSRMFYRFDQTTGQHERTQATFRGEFDNHFSNNGFGNTMFVSILYQYLDGDSMLANPDVSNASRKWNAFVKNNVIYDGNLKVGSKVKYIWWNAEHVGTVQNINSDFSRIKICRDDLCNRVENIPPGCIIEVDGEPVEFSFHIKWKGKEYGK